ncbi:hypothetical protein SDC9_80405 [bioreactor metagenome]|uniref:Uncharacterized protein n=1 Tax=bioreactor metagenome TaxID=1076179 RepID=A0A644Z6V2_9ZZZZ
MQRRVLCHRHRFTRKGRFLHPQRAALQQAQVRGNGVPRLQQHHVSRYQLGGGQAAQNAPPHDLRVGRGHIPQRLQRGLRLGLLHGAHEGVNEDDGGNDGRVHSVAQNGGNQCGADEHPNHEILELGQENHRPGAGLSLLQAVRADFLQPSGGLLRLQPLAPGVQLLEHLGRTVCVPWFL